MDCCFIYLSIKHAFVNDKLTKDLPIHKRQIVKKYTPGLCIFYCIVIQSLTFMTTGAISGSAIKWGLNLPKRARFITFVSNFYSGKSENSSEVEHQLPKLRVAGSIPVSRSRIKKGIGPEDQSLFFGGEGSCYKRFFMICL